MERSMVYLENSPGLFIITILDRCPSLAGVRLRAGEVHRRHVMKNSYAFFGGLQMLDIKLPKAYKHKYQAQVRESGMWW